MLCQLAISNIAVIGCAEISFGNGLNVLTGETGAGKSLIIDSINFVLGARTGRDIIRDGEKSARVDAAFLMPSDFFVQNDISGEDDNLIICREIHTDGRNLCKVNGKMISVAELREIGNKILSIHGQNDSHSLIKVSTHIDYVDKYADNQSVLEQYKKLYKEKTELARTIQELEDQHTKTAERLEIISFWADEIEQADLQPGEDEQLSELRQKLRNADKIRENITKAYQLIHGGDMSATDALSDGVNHLDLVSHLDNVLCELKDTFYDLLYKTQESARALSDYVDNLNDSKDELNMVEERLDLIYRLKNKYNKSVDEIIEYGMELRQQAQSVHNSEKIIADKKAEYLNITKQLEECAQRLSFMRKKAANEIEDRVVKELCDLDMNKTKFEICLESTDLGPDGADKCEFMISTNPAEPLKPLSKIASGGEMSRICLALKTVLSKADSIPTLIFDEIDQGISGRAAQKTGEKLKSLSEDKQILCITHLPQIASFASNHYLIEKDTSADNFTTTVTQLDKNGCIREIARMISGDRITEKALLTAEEMIKG